MEYILYKRFKSMALCGQVNLPALTKCFLYKDVLFYETQPLCSVYSENAHKYFSRNDDEMGVRRGKLTRKIIQVLSKRDEEYQVRWDKIWKDELCQKFKNKDDDFWLWNHEFYNAKMNELLHIACILNIKEEN